MVARTVARLQLRDRASYEGKEPARLHVAASPATPASKDPGVRRLWSSRVSWVGAGALLFLADWRRLTSRFAGAARKPGMEQARSGMSPLFPHVCR
jgi:hypothetical protein